MANIDRIVNVQIALNTTGVFQNGFSTLLVVGPHVNTLNRVTIYTSVDAMLEDGFTEDDALYRAVSDGFSQTPRPRQIKVGRRNVSGVEIAVKTLGASSAYTVTIAVKDASGNVVEKAYTHQNNNGSISDILTGLAEKIAEDTAAAVTATATGDVLALLSKDPARAIRVKISEMLMMTLSESTESIAETMAAVTGEDNDWYGWSLTSRKPEDILAAADWTEAHVKLLGTAVSGAGVKDSAVENDIGSQLMKGNYYRTHWWYHKDAATDFPEVAVAARCFAIEPGGETWANKKLVGVTTDTLNETEYNAITKKNGNTFELFRNVSITQNGKTAAGEWIDVIRFRDWLQEQITVNVFTLLVNRDKVPYTDNGIALIENQVRAALELGQRRGGIVPTEYDEAGNENPGYKIEVPLVANIPLNDKANRVLNDMKFTARLAGAIHVVNISGSLTYENLFSTLAS